MNSEKNSHVIDLVHNISSDTDLDGLLAYILKVCRKQQNADAGSIYIRERDQSGNFIDKLRFKNIQNDSINISDDFSEHIIDFDSNTISGYVAKKGIPLNIDDVYQIPKDTPYEFGKDLDKNLDYRSKSMLTVPLTNIEGTVVGVLQIINKKTSSKPLSNLSRIDGCVKSFTKTDIQSMQVITSLAAISIERAFLYEDIEGLFEGILSSSMAAVDAREGTTSGHSHRVMQYAMKFVEEINATTTGTFSEVDFSDSEKRQFRYAALLHDIGKLGVPEKILNKKTKIPGEAMQIIKERLDFIKWKLNHKQQDECLWEEESELETFFSFLKEVNRSGFLSQKNMARIKNIISRKYINAKGNQAPIIPEDYQEQLLIKKGNLIDSEKEIIKSHTEKTKSILSKIPWVNKYRRVPFIAAHHHEKIDGSGYPDGLTQEEIPLESKILAIIDIFEALVAADRGYKPAMEYSKAIKILQEEAKNNKLDQQIVDFFIDRNIYTLFKQ